VTPLVAVGFMWAVCLLSSLLLVHSMALVPGNSRFQVSLSRPSPHSRVAHAISRTCVCGGVCVCDGAVCAMGVCGAQGKVELTTLVKFFFPRWFYLIVLLILIVSLLSLIIASLIVSAQVPLHSCRTHAQHTYTHTHTHTHTAHAHTRTAHARVLLMICVRACADAGLCVRGGQGDLRGGVLPRFRVDVRRDRRQGHHPLRRRTCRVSRVVCDDTWGRACRVLPCVSYAARVVCCRPDVAVRSRTCCRWA
jgi:hypothetical protein